MVMFATWVPDGGFHHVLEIGSDFLDWINGSDKIEIHDGLLRRVDLPDGKARYFHPLLLRSDLIRRKGNAIGRGRDSEVAVD